MGDWRRLHSEEPQHLYLSPNIVQVMKSWRKGWMGHVVHTRRGEVHTGFWWGKLSERERERPLGICKQRWEDNSKMNLIEISWRDTY